MQHSSIAIVGAGPAGLTLARLLQMKDVDVRVYERSLNSNVRAQGATLDLHEGTGLMALREAGLLEEFKASYRPGAEKLLVMDKHANILLDEHVDSKEETSRPEIDRGPLMDILLNSLRPGTVVWNSHLVLLTKQNASRKLDFMSGTSATADLVVAADGANSKVRPYLNQAVLFRRNYCGRHRQTFGNSKHASALSFTRRENLCIRRREELDRELQR